MKDRTAPETLKGLGVLLRKFYVYKLSNLGEMNTFLDRNYNSSLKKKQKENSKNGRIRTSKNLSLH